MTSNKENRQTQSKREAAPVLCGVSAVWATDPPSHPLCGYQAQAGPCCAEGFAAGMGWGCPSTYSSWGSSCSCSTLPRRVTAACTGRSRRTPPWPSGSRSAGKSGERNQDLVAQKCGLLPSAPCLCSTCPWLPKTSPARGSSNKMGTPMNAKMGRKCCGAFR